MEPKSSLPHSQAPATCPCREPDQSNPCLPIPILEDPFLHYPPIYLGRRSEWRRSLWWHCTTRYVVAGSIPDEVPHYSVFESIPPPQSVQISVT